MKNQKVFNTFVSLLTFLCLVGKVSVETCRISITDKPDFLFMNCNRYGITEVPTRPPNKALPFDGLWMDDNSIEVFRSDDFVTWGTITALYADNNPLKTIEKGAFNPLKQLEKISLRASKLVVNEGITSQTFQPIPTLKIIRAQGSSFKVIPDFFFKHLPNLEEIGLRNQVGGLQVSKNSFAGLKSIKELDIAGNNIRFPRGFFPSSLEKTEISNNKFICDCHFRWFMNIKSLITDSPVCTGPDRIKGAKIRDLKHDDLTCKPEIISTPKDKSLHAEDTLRLFCEIYSDPRGKEFWLKDGVRVYSNSTGISIHPLEPSSVTGNMEIEVKNINNKDAGDWECQVENKLGKISAKIHVKVLLPASFFIALPIAILCFSIIGVICFYMYIHRKDNEEEEDDDDEEEEEEEANCYTS